MQNTNFIKTMPTFDIGDFVIREERDDDITNYFEYYSNPEVNKYILCTIPQNIEEARHDFYYWKSTFSRGDGAYFAIARKVDNKMIGSIGLTGFNSFHKRIEVSYDLSQEYWKKGIMSKAIQKICDYGFYEFKVNRIEANVVPQNLASKNLLEKNGFFVEGYLRQHRFHGGEFRDVLFFSLLRNDFYK